MELPGRARRASTALNRERRQHRPGRAATASRLGDAQTAVNNLPIMKKLPRGRDPRRDRRRRSPGRDDGRLRGRLSPRVSLIFGGAGAAVPAASSSRSSSCRPCRWRRAAPSWACWPSTCRCSIPSLIGFLMLMGLAAKNSILLVEYAIEREREGMPPARGPDGGLPRAGAGPIVHDHRGHGGRHAADRLRAWRRAPSSASPWPSR